MSQSSTSSQRRPKWHNKPSITYDCPICVTSNTNQLIELPCGHNLCLSCLHMICAHSSLSCPFCRCRISTWLRHNPDYSKLIIKREIKPRKYQKKIIVEKEQPPPPPPKPKRRRQTAKPKPTIDEFGQISDDWLLARTIHYEQLEQFRYTHGRITRAMAKKMVVDK